MCAAGGGGTEFLPPPALAARGRRTLLLHRSSPIFYNIKILERTGVGRIAAIRPPPARRRSGGPARPGEEPRPRMRFLCGAWDSPPLHARIRGGLVGGGFGAGQVIRTGGALDGNAVVHAVGAFHGRSIDFVKFEAVNRPRGYKLTVPIEGYSAGSREAGAIGFNGERTGYPGTGSSYFRRYNDRVIQPGHYG